MSASRPSRPSLQRRELRRSGWALGQRCLCWAQAMTQTLVWSLDLIKCSSFPSCFPLHSCRWPWAHHQALGTRLPPQLLSHLCTLLPPRNLLYVPSLPQCPCVALCLPHPVPGSPASPLLSFPLCLAVPSGPGKNTACPRVVESFSPGVCHLKPCSLFLVACHPVFLPLVLPP